MDKKKKQEDKQQNDDVQLDDQVQDQSGVGQEDFDQLKSDFDNLSNQLKRAVADYQNLEKRVAEGRSEFANWANTELLRKLLTVLDHYEKALGGASEGDRASGWFRGVELATQQFKTVLKEEGLEEIEAGGQFDPGLHEAVDTKEGEDNQVLEVLEKGYNLNGKVVKPVKVVVGRKGVSS